MPSPDQLAELQNPEILRAFFADVKTSEIQSKLDAIKAENPALVSNGNRSELFLRNIAAIRQGGTY